MRRFDVALFAFLVVACMLGCKGPYDAAWRTLDGIQKARALTAQQLAASAKVKHKDCVKAHGSQTAEFAACIKGHREAIRQWRENVRPAVNSAVQITATALQIAERVKTEKKLDWMSLLKPAACSLLRVAKAWGHYYADKGAAILGALTAFEGVICK